jgi:hypothetical protein
MKEREREKKNYHATYILTLLILLLSIHYDADNVFSHIGWQTIG